jgi:amino acid transporter
MSLASVRRFIIGERLPTAHVIHTRLPKWLALPVFGSDPISSSAYATEEILLALVVAGSVGLHYAAGVALAIALLFAIVSISYRQTVMAYPQGGGAYRVARENLGTYPGLVAAASVLTDYLLTVAVSVSAGVAAVVSAAPALGPYRVHLGVLFIAFITLANLRGARESGKLFAPPVYLFVGTVVLMIGVGLYRLAAGLGPAAVAQAPGMPVAQAVTMVLLLRAFASGCAALTGIEAISDGVQAFKPPESRNAATTLLWMVGICITLFIGITVLTQAFHIVPDQSGRQTVLSMLGRAAFGDNVFYLVLQAATAAVLVLAANTAFADFPRLSSILARDGFAPRQLANLGDRLVFSNGIILLGAFASLLIAIFQGKTHLLIPLYAVGVFVSFTLSQLGMVMRWRRVQGRLWKVKAAVNAVGAVVTGVVLIVVGSIKFTHGAFVVLLLIPLLVLGLRKVSVHYGQLRAALSVRGVSAPRAVRHAVVVLVPGVHRGVLTALAYAKSISPSPEAVFVEVDPSETDKTQERWRELGIDVPLTVLRSPWRSLTEPILRYLRTLKSEQRLDLVTVIVPEFVTTRWWEGLLHNQSGLMLKLALLFEPSVVVTNVRYRGEE